MNRRSFLGLGIAAAAVSVAGCNANPKTTTGASAGASGSVSAGANAFTTQTPTKGGTLKVLSTSKEVHFDPAKSQILATSLAHNVWRSLTTWKTSPTADTELVADLATDTGTTTDGGKTWKFTLKDGLKYSDGTPITAADVKFGVERSFDAQLQGGLGYHKTLLVGGSKYTGPASGKHLDSIEVSGDKEITFHLVRAFADWPWIASMPAFAPIPATRGMGIPAYDHTPPASGPYMVKSYAAGSSVVLVRNPNWDAKTDTERPAWPDEIHYEMGLDPQTAAQRMASDSGEDKNATGPAVTAALITKVNADPSLKQRVYVSPSGAVKYLVMNMTRPGLKDLAVRQAINYAVNKQQVQTIAGGPTFGGDIATTFMPKGIKGHKDFDLYPAPATGDQTKAKQLLAGKTVPALRLVIDSSSATEPQWASSIANDLKAVGITVNIVSQDADAATDTLSKSGDFDLGFSGWQADYPSAYAALQPLVASSEIGNGNYNMARLSDPAIDKAIVEASAETDATKAATLWGAIDEMAIKQAPVVPLLYAKNAFIYGSNVGGSYIPSFPTYTNALQQGLKKP